jgi:hypothetical protein
MGLLNTFFGLKSNGQDQDIIELTAHQDVGEGWQDLVFTITKKTKLDIGYWDLICKAKYSEQIVGIRIYILEGILPGLIGNDVDNTKFIREAVKIESVGEESDKFIEIVSKLYGQKIRTQFSTDVLEYTVFPLNEKKADLETGAFKFKLFFDDTDEKGLYSELFLNSNFPDGTIELNEKDKEYRKNIVKSMSKY